MARSQLRKRFVGLTRRDDGTLHRKYRQHNAALPGNVQEPAFRGRLAEPVDGLNPTGTGAGALESDSGRDGRLVQAKETCRLRRESYGYVTERGIVMNTKSDKLKPG